MGLKDDLHDKYNFIGFFEKNDEFSQYEENSLALFALSLYLRIEDINEFAASSICDGGDDKKIDIFYLDEIGGRVIIAQNYLSKKWGKAEAKANKASDLNTAVVWLLSVEEARIPLKLKTKAIELRKALSENRISRIELMFIHNCHESLNVQEELKSVAEHTQGLVKSYLSDEEFSRINISHLEFGLETIERHFNASDSEILVDEWIDLPCTDFLQHRGTRWNAILTTVSGNWISELFKKHGDKLFSANYRDYLGSIDKKGEINRGITSTAENEPENFWVYNNGITALTNKISVGENVRIEGISIINGAQTTGALGELKAKFLKEPQVLFRIVECHPHDLVDKIIRFNNTQNAIKASDKRSNDSIQTRLTTEFEPYRIFYIPRRSATRTPRNAITAAHMAPILCAFHGDSQTAFRNANIIFEDDDMYFKIFPNNITINHIFLLKCLSTAISNIRTNLREDFNGESLTSTDSKSYEFLRYSASKHFLYLLMGELVEEILGKRVTDSYKWGCKEKYLSNSDDVVKAWEIVLETVLPQIILILDQPEKSDLYDVPRSSELSRQAVSRIRSIIASLKTSLTSQFLAIRKCTEVKS